MRNAGLDESQAGIKTGGRNNNHRYADDTTLITTTTLAEKEVRQGWVLPLCLFNLYAEYIMRNAGLGEAQAGIKIAGRNINHHRYAMTPSLWQVKKN